MEGTLAIKLPWMLFIIFLIYSTTCYELLVLYRGLPSFLMTLISRQNRYRYAAYKPDINHDFF
jgi:hypothetical protein